MKIHLMSQGNSVLALQARFNRHARPRYEGKTSLNIALPCKHLSV